MKKTKTLLCLALALLMLLLPACAGPGTPGETAGPAAPSDTAPDMTADPFSRPDYIAKDRYDGYEFIVLMTNLNASGDVLQDFGALDTTTTVIEDAQFRRNERVAEELDVKLTGITDYSSSNTGYQKVVTANKSGDNVYDMGVIATYDAGRLATAGELRDLSSLGFLKLEQPWWDQNINRDVNFGGHIYFTTGDISLTTTMAMYNLVFNKDMFREKKWDMPYDTVREGKWTFDKMKEYVLQISEDLDGNEVMNDQDRYGFVYIKSTIIAFLGTAGEQIARVDGGEIKLTLNTERAEKAIVDFVEMTQDRDHCLNGQTNSSSAVGMFSDGKCLFRAGEHIMFHYFRDTDLDYGILPLPKLDEQQERYYTPFGGWDASFVCVPNCSEDAERTSTVMEYLAKVSRELVTPAYYEKTLVGRTVRDEESTDMITIEINNRVFDVGYIYDIGGYKNAIEQLSSGFSTRFSSMYAAYSRKAEKDVANANAQLFSGN